MLRGKTALPFQMRKGDGLREGEVDVEVCRSRLLVVLAAGIVISDVLSIGWLYSGPTFTATTVWSSPAQVAALRRILGG
jgi:hypothetical protein